MAAHRPLALQAGGSGAVGALLYAAAQRAVFSPETRAVVDCFCEAADLDGASISALAAELAERLPLAAIVFVAAAAGSYCGFRVGRGQWRPRALYER